MKANRCWLIGLLLALPALPVGLGAQDNPKDEPAPPRGTVRGQAAITGPSAVEQVWVTTPGVIFVLWQMPDGVRFFSADRGSDLKLSLLLKAVEQNWAISVVYDNTGDDTREAVEIRFRSGPSRAR